jgi:hypothetical protein
VPNGPNPMHGGADQPCNHPLPMPESGLPHLVFGLASVDNQATQVRAPTPYQSDRRQAAGMER